MRTLFTRLVVATDEEYEEAKELFPELKIIKTGVGALNVYRKLRRVPRWFHIINWGYAGSNTLTKGYPYYVSASYLYHPTVDYDDVVFELPVNDFVEGVPCYTSNDFVTHTDIKEPCLFDMELAYIVGMGFKNVSAIKIVSDNLSLHEYEDTVSKSKKGK